LKNSALEMAVLEQRKADENVWKLAADQKVCVSYFSAFLMIECHFHIRIAGC